MKCPGQDRRYWKPGDIFDVECPQCGNGVEFFKDEVIDTRVFFDAHLLTLCEERKKFTPERVFDDR